MSNGGHSSSSHGIAMTYKLGELEFVFRTKSGLYWNVKYDNALEDKWYHVTVSWTNEKGLKLYINGDLVSESSTPEQRLFFKPCFDSLQYFDFFMFVSCERGSIQLFLLCLVIVLICRMAITRNPRFNEFLIGRSNDRTGMDSLGIITVDDLKFWSEYKDEYQIREIGKSTANNSCRRQEQDLPQVIFCSPRPKCVHILYVKKTSHTTVMMTRNIYLLLFC